MKKYIIITIISMLSINCKSQSHIVDIMDYDGKAIIGYYYKDVNNLLDPFTGTWVYSNGNKFIKLVLTKKVKLYNGKIYNDVVVGGIEYKENNNTIVNTIPYLSNSYSYYMDYAISGSFLFNKDFYPKCFDCQPNELRLQLSYHELNPETSFGRLVLRKIKVNGQDAIKAELIGKTVYYEAGTTPPLDFKLPGGEYIFIKQ
ncbi:DUF6705 family protein [Chryseobacterium gambrini]|uniref:DUF6705 family protein n=1 Tax=Chryseobacterium gambrini TaxID=373672 RepID=UPI0022F39CAB|nr:DUF6705 family protein [Chryseobacterium gambrini]WBX95918.1 hypothetical protein PE065_13655 [Chryseobacterium gambrini]